MDKYEYKVRAEEIKSLIAGGEFAEAVKIADTIDWHRVKSVMMLCTISDLYKINRRFQESKEILLMAYERHPGGRLIVYSLCELSIKMGEFVQAIEYYKEFVQIAPKDTGRYILQYKLYEAQDVSLEERIAVLEEFKKRDYREKWAYELAYLYHRVGLETKCVEECDEMILWFGDGRYVLKALELKQLHQPLSETQQETYLRIKQGKEQPEEDLEEEEEREEEETGEENPEGPYGEEEEEPEEEQPEEIGDAIPGPEEEFKVKTVDLGQYNTINLQKELAESMREILGDGGQRQQDTDGRSPFVEAVVAPLLQETGDMYRSPSKEKKELVHIGELEFVELDEEEEPEEEELRKRPKAREKEAVSGKVKPALPGAEPQAALEEVFFEEDARDILQQETKRINLGDTKEIIPGQKLEYPSVLPSRYTVAGQNMPSVLEEGQQEETGQEAAAVEVEEAPQTIQAQPNLMIRQKPSGFEQMLSQEYDGQISLVVPSNEKVEKQITGQMNIADIMAEWERMKRANEEKRREDVRKRVQKHTGNMFSEFDEATKSGLLEQLEKAAVEAILKESGQGTVNPEELSEQQLNDIVKSVGRRNAASALPPVQTGGNVADIRDAMAATERAGHGEEGPARGLQEELQAYFNRNASADELPEGMDIEEITENVSPGRAEESILPAGHMLPEDMKQAEEAPGEGEAPQINEAPETSFGGASGEERPPGRNMTPETAGLEGISGTPGTEGLDGMPEAAGRGEKAGQTEDRSGTDGVQGSLTLAEIAGGTEVSGQEAKADGQAEKSRAFTPEEKELFGRFSHNRKSREQILHAVDVMSMDSYSGNVIVTGEEEAGTLDLAKNLVRMMQLTDGNFSGKVAKISGDTLNKKDVPATLAKLTDGALIIEHATDMSSGTATDLNKALGKENRGIFVIMEGKKDEMNIFLRKNRTLLDNFNARIDIDSLNDQALVEYAKQYAEEMEYSIDELGILALHTRIADMQTSDHEVTVAEVRDLVDDAIYFADKKNPKHFFDVLFGKRYDAEDMIILREKDFMHY